MVDIVHLMSAMGQGLSEDKMMEMMNVILKQKIEEGSHEDVSYKTIRRFYNRHPELYTCIAGSIDPQRAEQANPDTRDAFFLKLDAYIKLLHEMGAVS